MFQDPPTPSFPSDQYRHHAARLEKKVNELQGETGRVRDLEDKLKEAQAENEELRKNAMAEKSQYNV